MGWHSSKGLFLRLRIKEEGLKEMQKRATVCVSAATKTREMNRHVR